MFRWSRMQRKRETRLKLSRPVVGSSQVKIFMTDEKERRRSRAERDPGSSKKKQYKHLSVTGETIDAPEPFVNNRLPPAERQRWHGVAYAPHRRHTVPDPVTGNFKISKTLSRQ